MASLLVPDVRFHASWLEAQAEFDGVHMDGAGVEEWAPADLRDAGSFGQFVAALVADAYPGTPRKAGYVPCSYRWIVSDDTFLGSIAVRHDLTSFLLEEGGHIGYSVRPTARRHGHASRALRDALPIARSLGIERLLITCDEDNAGSRATIEGRGGVYEDTRKGNRRYWIDLTVSSF